MARHITQSNIKIQMTTKKQTTHKTNLLQQGLIIVYLVCGMFAIYHSVIHAIEITHSNAIVVLGIVVVSMVTVTRCYYKPKSIHLFGIGWLFTSLLFYIRIREEIATLLQAIDSQLYRFYGFSVGFEGTYTDSLTLLLLLFFTGLILITYYLVFLKQRRVFAGLLAMIAIVLTMLLGYNPTFLEMFLYLLFVIGSICVIGNGEGKKTIIGNENRKAQIISATLLTSTISVVFLVTYLLSSFYVPVLMNQANGWGSGIVDYINQNMDTNSLSNTDVQIDNGRINRGNLLQVGREELEVRTDKRPESVVYIKGYIGDEYEGERWSESNEHLFFEDLSVNYSTANARRWNSVTHKSYPFLEQWNADTNIPNGEDAKTQITIEKLRNQDQSFYAPYHSEFVDSEDQDITFTYFDENVFNNVVTALRDSGYDFGYDAEYASYVRENYLNYPEETLSRFSELLSTQPYTGNVEGATAYIQQILAENTTYTTTPTEIPPDQDIADYFFFESKEGYCVHYATTATLMFRMFDIPARYVTGFIASPSSFMVQGDGTYRSVLADTKAHAWVEVYDDEIGWYPIEVTPANSVADLNENNNSNANIDTPETPDEQPETPEEDTPDTPEPEEIETTSEQQAFIVPAIVYSILAVIVTLLGAGLLLRLYRKTRLRKRQQESVGQIFKRILLVLQASNKLENYQGIEDHFAIAFQKEVPWMHMEDVEKMMDILQDEAFGNQKATKEEKEYIRHIHRKVATDMKGNMPFYKYLYYKYIKVYF